MESRREKIAFLWWKIKKRNAFHELNAKERIRTTERKERRRSIYQSIFHHWTNFLWRRWRVEKRMWLLSCPPSFQFIWRLPLFLFFAHFILNFQSFESFFCQLRRWDTNKTSSILYGYWLVIDWKLNWFLSNFSINIFLCILERGWIFVL